MTLVRFVASPHGNFVKPTFVTTVFPALLHDLRAGPARLSNKSRVTLICSVVDFALAPFVAAFLSSSLHLPIVLAWLTTMLGLACVSFLPCCPA